MFNIFPMFRLHFVGVVLLALSSNGVKADRKLDISSPQASNLYGLQQQLIAQTEHVAITPVASGTKRLHWRELESVVLAQQGERIAAIAPYVFDYTLARPVASAANDVGGTNRGLRVIQLRGVEPSSQVRVGAMAEQISDGGLTQLTAQGYGIILGRQLANEMGVGQGDQIDVIYDKHRVTPLGSLIRTRRFTVVGIATISSVDRSRVFALAGLNAAARLFEIDENQWSLQLALHDPMEAKKVAMALNHYFAERGLAYEARSWDMKYRHLLQVFKR